jgi:hypothetical protein
MSLIADPNIPVPASRDAAAYVWHRAVKIFERSSSVLLESDINNFINTLMSAAERNFIIDVALMQSNGSNVRALVSYGYFSPP